MYKSLFVCERVKLALINGFKAVIFWTFSAKNKLFLLSTICLPAFTSWHFNISTVQHTLLVFDFSSLAWAIFKNMGPYRVFAICYISFVVNNIIITTIKEDVSGCSCRVFPEPYLCFQLGIYYIWFISRNMLFNKGTMRAPINSIG